jgi:ketosteroid isomerase-like protein
MAAYGAHRLRERRSNCRIDCRTAYELFAKGDIPGFFALCSPDMKLHVPSESLAGGTHTIEELAAAFGHARKVTGGGYREEVQRIVANDTDG